VSRRSRRLPTHLASAALPTLLASAGLCTGLVLASSAPGSDTKTTTTATTTTATTTTATTTTTPTSGTGTTYYVSTSGSDLNAGTSASAPWKTIAKANAAVQAGDTVVLSGNFVKEAIAPRNSGTATAPITYQAGPAGASLDQPGLVSGTPYMAWFGLRSYITVNGIGFTNSNYVNAPVTYKGVFLRKADHITITNCSFTHVPIVVQASSFNTISHNTFRYFVASYVNPSTRAPDPNHPITAGDMLYVFGGSNNNLIQYNDMKYAGHSLIEIGNGFGGTNANNVISDNILSNPWYKPLILADDGAGTIVERNLIEDANSVPTLYSTVPGAVGSLSTASTGVQFSGSNFIFRHNTLLNNTAIYGVIDLGSRWYTDANHPNGVLVQSLNNQIYNNTLYGNHAAAGIDFVVFMSQADVTAGRVVPKLTGNLVKDNILWGNSGTPYSYHGSKTYSSLIYHAASYAPAWPGGGYNGNTITGNDFDSATSANLNDVWYAPTGSFTHVQQSLPAFQSYAAADASANLSVNPQFVNPASGNFSLAAGTPVSSLGQ
jgi:hypothetical protein